MLVESSDRRLRVKVLDQDFVTGWAQRLDLKILAEHYYR